MNSEMRDKFLAEIVLGTYDKAKSAAELRLSGNIVEAMAADRDLEILYRLAKANGFSEDAIFAAEERGREDARK